ncbi:hypothetical protein STAQ_10280 [Allostella sp. ATCC 35155]|nr:hypothetical protein STAQ_10280 [Stella sp. ATCC 35155]
MTADAFARAWAKLGEPVCNLARMKWEDDGRPEGAEGEYVRRARLEFEADRPYRVPGAAGPQGGRAGRAERGSDLGRPMSDDEKVDEAVLESMDASDPPSHSGTESGAPERRRSRD